MKPSPRAIRDRNRRAYLLARTLNQTKAARIEGLTPQYVNYIVQTERFNRAKDPLNDPHWRDGYD